MNRRNALKALMAGSAVCLMPSGAFAGPRCTGRLSIHNIHTQENIAVRYFRRNGGFDPEAREKLDRFFRCHYNDKVHKIDPQLFRFLDLVHAAIGCNQPYELISGYRSPEYNEVLRQRSGGVAKRSYHLRGKAADVAIPGVPMETLRQAARRLTTGGVGIYSNFVHVDTGPERSWG